MRNRYYSEELKQQIRQLRSHGKTYGEIQKNIRQQIPKSTLSDLCKSVKLPKGYAKRILKLNYINFNKGRLIAVETNKIKREEFFNTLKKINFPISTRIKDKEIAKIALAMLCLGEASKYNPLGRRSFNLGNSDYRIIILFLGLLKYCYDFHLEKVRCTVQCRADQDTEALEKYWMDVTGIPKNLFYKTRIDPRTIGKPTRKKDYKGVLKVDYFDGKVQHDLESLADLVYNFVIKGPEV